jgi:hypothetical protein
MFQLRHTTRITINHSMCGGFAIHTTKNMIEIASSDRAPLPHEPSSKEVFAFPAGAPLSLSLLPPRKGFGQGTGLGRVLLRGLRGGRVAPRTRSQFPALLGPRFSYSAAFPGRGLSLLWFLAWGPFCGEGGQETPRLLARRGFTTALIL